MLTEDDVRRIVREEMVAGQRVPVSEIRLGPRRETPDEERERVRRMTDELSRVVTPASPTRHTTDPTDPRLRRGSDDTPRPQNEAYLVLSEAERAKGYLRPVRNTYRHVGALTQLETDSGTPSHQVRTGGCGTTTTMGAAIAETYARDPWHYGSTYCVTCQKHRPLKEFVWLTGESMDPAEWPREVLDAVVARRKELGEA